MPENACKYNFLIVRAFNRMCVKMCNFFRPFKGEKALFRHVKRAILMGIVNNFLFLKPVPLILFSILPENHDKT